MSGFFQNLLTDAAGAFFGSDYLRDYTHASKTFRTNFYQYSPKFKYLFHTYFEIDGGAYNQSLGTGANFGLAVKTVKLPSYNFSTDNMNQYNRKRIVQTKINYDPVVITFHDDNGNMMRNLWKAYYTYYYNDGRNAAALSTGIRGGPIDTQPGGGGTRVIPTGANYFAKTTYADSITGNADWGYIGETNIPSNPDGSKSPFFKHITIYGLSRHQGAAYTLINPIITSFSHDTYDYAQGTGTMEMTMTIEYETVVYNEFQIDGRTPDRFVPGFGVGTTYDRTLSPINKPGANGTILGQGGLVDAAGGFLTDIDNKNYLGAIQKAGTAYNTFKNVNLIKNAKQELLTGLQNSLNNAANITRNSQFDIPVNAASPGPANLAGSPTTGAKLNPALVGTPTTAGKQVP
jgi:hypothetical protein